MQPRDTCVRGKVSVRAQLSGDAKPQVLWWLQRHQSPLAVLEGVGAAGPGSHNSKPPCSTLASNLVELQLSLGKGGLSTGGWRLLLKGLFHFFLLPICKKGLRQASAACLPEFWPCLFQQPGFSGKLPSQRSAALGTILGAAFRGVQ